MSKWQRRISELLQDWQIARLARWWLQRGTTMVWKTGWRANRRTDSHLPVKWREIWWSNQSKIKIHENLFREGQSALKHIGHFALHLTGNLIFLKLQPFTVWHTMMQPV